MSPTPPKPDLHRFLRAQDDGDSLTSAMSELEAGRKVTHWIWWVFPQVAGLGLSPTSVRYALTGHAEACAYLAHDLLRGRLAAAMAAVHTQLTGPNKRPLDRLMGSEVDARKLVSSMTLFAEVMSDAAVRELPDVLEMQAMAVAILAVARAARYPACEHTLRVLRAL